MRFLVVAPHPDDAELGMGGTIIKLISQGHAVHLLDMTNGEPTPNGSPEIREREWTAATKLLGCTRSNLGLKNREVTHDLASRYKLAAVIREHRPSTMFIPFSPDAHPDHVAITRIAEDARVDAKLSTTNLSTMFKGASSYYSRELASKGLGATNAGSCSVPSTAGTLPAAPDDQKHQVDFTAVPTFEALGFSSPDPVYFGYGVTSTGGTCGNAGNADIYTFYAIGDLDGDGDTSLIELAASSDGSNVLRHAVGFYLHDEWE